MSTVGKCDTRLELQNIQLIKRDKHTQSEKVTVNIDHSINLANRHNLQLKT